jgi:signal transduction histidine kinase
LEQPDQIAGLLATAAFERATLCASSRRPQRILAIDDDPATLTLLATHLTPLGYAVATASSEQTAIASFDAEEPDLVLLDVVMPGIGGLGVLAHIQGHMRGGHVPVILITAHSERSHRLIGLRAGADEFLEKPIDVPIMLARVKTLLRLKQAVDDLQLSRNVLAARNSALESLQREQRELTQFVVHDLKNQLTVVLVSIDCAQSRALAQHDSEMCELLNEGDTGAQRLRTMVEDLLAVSKLEESLPVQCQRVTVAELISPVAAAYQSRARKHAVSLTLPSNATCAVSGDTGLLRRVFENILDNALRYTPQGGHISFGAQCEQGIELTISNDGPPIPLEQRESIFDKFNRGSSEPSSIGNAGLGLYFCKRAIEAHGGHISVRQTHEWPTSFVIQLPASA